jgi:hypothetical protein
MIDSLINPPSKLRLPRLPLAKADAGATLTGELGLELDILVVGSVDPKLQSDYSGKKTRFLSYRAVIANARTQLEWLIKPFNEKP